MHSSVSNYSYSNTEITYYTDSYRRGEDRIGVTTEYSDKWGSNPFTLYYEEPAYRALECREHFRDKAIAFSTVAYNTPSSLLNITRVMETYTSIVK